MRFAFLGLMAALGLAAPALADDQTAITTAPATVQPVASAPSGPPVGEPATLTVGEQIDAFLRSSPARDVATGDAPDGVVRDRKVHGEFAVGVGTHGYRSLYARADVPLGERGFLSIAVEDSRGPAAYERGLLYRGYGGYDGSGFNVARDLRGCGLEALTPARPLDAVGGPNGRCRGVTYARPAGDWPLLLGK